MGVHVNGLTLLQWLLSVGISLVSLVINFLLKFISEKWFPEMGDENKDDVVAAKEDYSRLLKFRKTRELSSSMRQGNFIKNKEGGSFK
tara:strand:+ start:3462 stop:3725 length:264 start_codon:yes stop_codon:yes gene_type:complete